MSLTDLLHGQTALILAIILSGLTSPFISALLTKAPTFLTGVLTTLVSALGAFIGEWQASPHHFDWKTALSATLGGWLIGLAVHNGWLKDTPLQAQLHAVGTKKTAA